MSGNVVKFSRGDMQVIVTGDRVAIEMNREGRDVLEQAKAIDEYLRGGLKKDLEHILKVMQAFGDLYNIMKGVFDEVIIKNNHTKEEEYDATLLLEYDPKTLKEHLMDVYEFLQTAMLHNTIKQDVKSLINSGLSYDVIILVKGRNPHKLLENPFSVKKRYISAYLSPKGYTSDWDLLVALKVRPIVDNIIEDLLNGSLTGDVIKRETSFVDEMMKLFEEEDYTVSKKYSAVLEKIEKDVFSKLSKLETLFRNFEANE